MNQYLPSLLIDYNNICIWVLCNILMYAKFYYEAKVAAFIFILILVQIGKKVVCTFIFKYGYISSYKIVEAYFYT